MPTHIVVKGPLEKRGDRSMVPVAPLPRLHLQGLSGTGSQEIV